MKINKKYLISNGCSFTEGHKLGSSASWATHLAQELDLELINLGKGGTGNEIITQSTIDYSTIEHNIAKDSFYVIQLTECLRYLINWDTQEVTKKNRWVNTNNKSKYWHITPVQFLAKDGFANWDLSSPITKHIYDNRYGLAPFFSNITFSLIKTYWNIINFVNFCEKNNYPYLIFDGINNHIPNDTIKSGIHQWYLDGTNSPNEFEINVSYAGKFKEFINKTQSAVLHINFIDYIKGLKYYYHDTTLNKFCHARDNGDYHKGNDGHPNVLGAKMWALHLKNIIKIKHKDFLTVPLIEFSN